MHCPHMQHQNLGDICFQPLSSASFQLPATAQRGESLGRQSNYDCSITLNGAQVTSMGQHLIACYFLVGRRAHEITKCYSVTTRHWYFVMVPV